MKVEHLTIKLEDIVVPDIKIRKTQKDHERYTGLRKSIILHGVQQEILVTDVINKETNKKVPGVYLLIEGLQRVSASKDASNKTIPAKYVPNISPDDALLLQAALNVHRIPQKPRELLQHIKRLMILHPEWTRSHLAEAMSETVNRINTLLKLDGITPEAMELVDNGKLKLSKAVALATIPQENQNDYLAMAMEDSSDVWINKAPEIRKTIIKARKEGKDSSTDIVIPHPLKRVELLALHEAIQSEFEIADIADKVAYAVSTARHNLIRVILQIDDETIARKRREAAERKQKTTEDRIIKRREDAQKAEAEVLSRRKEHSKLKAESIA